MARPRGAVLLSILGPLRLPNRVDMRIMTALLPRLAVLLSLLVWLRGRVLVRAPRPPRVAVLLSVLEVTGSPWIRGLGSATEPVSLLGVPREC